MLILYNEVNEVQTYLATPIDINHALKHLPQSTESRAVLGSVCEA